MVSLLTDDALLTMPPVPFDYQGHEAIARFLSYREEARGTPLRVVLTGANTQPALACYLPDADTGIARPRGLFVLTLDADAVAAITWFADTALFQHFGLPRSVRPYAALRPAGKLGLTAGGPFQCGAQIGRQLRGELHLLAGARVPEAQPRRVQELALQAVAAA